MIITAYNIHEACIDCCIYLAIAMPEFFCNPQAETPPKATGNESTCADFTTMLPAHPNKHKDTNMAGVCKWLQREINLNYYE